MSILFATRLTPPFILVLPTIYTVECVNIKQLTTIKLFRDDTTAINLFTLKSFKR